MRLLTVVSWICSLHFCLVAASNETEQGSSRQGKLFNIFQIIRFANDVCAGGSKNGTCYTQQECEARGGTNSGSCASGYGVCCVFNINCGQTSSENCTYFESNAVMAGGCKSTICPCGDNICQLRLDFNNFVITGPVTASTSDVALTTVGGVPVSGGQTVSLQSQCLTDNFQVVGGGGVSNSDVICGTNSGEHLYVEAEEASCCNDLVFQLGNNGFEGQTIANRQWSIKVTQYSCNHPNLAPVGCTQYFFGETTGTVRTFNFNNGNGHHLANQDQTVCVRRERTFCRICWFVEAASDFKLSGTGSTGMGSGFNVGSQCCGYGADGMGTMGFDCINIPGAEKAATAPAVMTNSNFCGRSNGLVTKSGNSVAVMTTDTNLNSKTICSRRTPFYLRFRSDNWEFSMVEGKASQDIGAQLGYFMDATNCNN